MVVYELLNHWIQYGRPGGTPLDFDVKRGTEVLGRFDSREEAEQELRRVRRKSTERVFGTTVDEEFDEYEIRTVELPE
jgi:hypothetical protein